MTKPLVPDSIHPYLNEISERLWSGHAAVMVGAGFSRNANSSFPDWAQLGDLFYEKIHGKKPDTQSKYLNALKLADEVQAALGRPALDQILRDSIPDSDYEPSPLHVKLLNLPWSDVFTTNYDTLLERACVTVTSQKYDVVVNKEDLVYSEKPRIVKLHGSFPSDRPFVITEEDYRRYPKDLAPFVNTVRQTLLENTLCLIGFSGDDPNFLQWIGWIRDNLGQKNSPKIYLIGSFHLSDAQKKLLEQRNIVLVDMSGHQGIEKEYYNDLEQFLDYLSSKKAEYNQLEWPQENDEFREPDRETKTDKTEQLSKLLPTWQKQRLSYPGWVIVPDDGRRSLWSSTKNWVNFLSAEDNLSDFVDLKFAFELSWRMQKCLSPLFVEQIAFFESIVEKYSALSNVDTPIDSSNTSISKMRYSETEQNEIREMVRQLMLWMLRYYREEGLLEKWKELYIRIEQCIAKLSPEHSANFHYERALFALFKLNLQEVKERLAEWQVNRSLPFWEAKKAGLLAEIGQIEQAQKILKTSLTDIRSRLNLKPIASDYSMVSQESFVMLLLRYVDAPLAIKEADWSKVQEIQKEFLERWNTLKQYKCDPWGELKTFESSLEHPHVKGSEVTEKKEFDIGQITKTVHMGSWDKEAWTAYNLLRFCEDTGIPFRIPGSSFGKKSVEGTLPRISEHSSYWAMATMVRIGDNKVVDHIFNRTSLCRMETVSVDALVEQYLNSLEQSSADIQLGDSFHNHNFGVVLAEVVPEILSRLCCKCSLDAKEKLFNFLIEAYQSGHRGNYKGIRNLTKRLMEAFSVQQRYNLIPRLLDLTIPENHNPIENREFINPIMCLHVDKEQSIKWDKPLIPAEKINVLLEKVSSNKENTRKWAILTLGKMHDLALLSDKQSYQFANALWGQLDDFGLPSNTDYYKFAFLAMPHPQNVEPIALFKNYIKREQFPIQANNPETGIPITHGNIPVFIDIINAPKHIEWTDKEINSIFDRLIEWWDADKRHLKMGRHPSPWGSTADEFKARFKNLVDILVVIITPDFNLNGENNKKETLMRVIVELKDHGVPVLRLESACLHIFPEWTDEVFERIYYEMTSSNLESVIDCLKAILIIVERTRDKKDSSKILALLGQMILWQKKTCLPNALNIITTLVKKHSWTFTDELERSTLMGLHAITNDTSMNGNDLDIFEKLPVREAAARLAYTLFEHYTKQSKPVPDVIIKWESICLSNDEFAEIRNQWI